MAGSMAALALNLFRATSCWYLESSLAFLGISILVVATWVIPRKPRSALAIWGLVSPICCRTRSDCASDSSKVLLSCGLPENRFMALSTPVFLPPLTTATFVPSS